MTRSHFQPHLLMFSCRIEEGCKPKNEQFLVEKRAKKYFSKFAILMTLMFSKMDDTTVENTLKHSY